MIFRSIDGSGDWNFGQGRNSYFTAEAAINANIKTRLLIFLGEVFWSLQSGVDWLNLIGAKNPGAQASIILQCRTVIVESYGVVQVRSVLPVYTPGTRDLTVTYTIDTIYSRGVVGTLDPVLSDA